LCTWISERNIAVAAVFFDAGRENRELAPLWARLPETPGSSTKDSTVNVNVIELLPKDRSYYTFESSLTTPPCTEGRELVCFETSARIVRGAAREIREALSSQ
jgi:carbonic anhydrase